VRTKLVQDLVDELAVSTHGNPEAKADAAEHH
jgi:hypothetical protein